MASEEHATVQEADTSEDVVIGAIPVKYIDNVDSIELVSENLWEDRLIEEVKRYPILWDRNRRDYGHQEKCAVIWGLISKVLGRVPAYCSGQWKNLRDSYVRRLKCVRRLAFHGLTPRKPCWRHFDSMAFLDDHVAHRGNVDSRTDQPLPNCSAKNVAFFDDGSPRAPNKNALGGIRTKKGPSSVRISTLPKEPVALFSRLGTGEVSVIDDTDRLDDDAFAKKDDSLEKGTVDSITDLVLDSGYSVVDGEDSGEKENVVFVIVEENTDPSDSACQNADSEEDRSGFSAADSEPIVSESEKTDTSSRKRPNPMNLESSSNETKRTCNNDAAKPDVQNEIRSELGIIRQELSALSDARDDDTNLFARYVATSLTNLPRNIRAEAKLKIQRILYEAEVSMDGESISSSKDGSMQYSTQVVHLCEPQNAESSS